MRDISGVWKILGLEDFKVNNSRTRYCRWHLDVQVSNALIEMDLFPFNLS